MGVISKVAETVGSVIGGIAGAVAGAVEIVKDIGEKIADGAADILHGITRWFEGDVSRIREVPEYSPNNAGIEETKKVNELLDKCVRGYGKEAEEYDEIAKKIIKNQFDLLEDKLIEINLTSKEKIVEDYIFQIFENNSTQIIKNLDKIYSKQISNVFSLNNNKLLDILKMPSGKEKGDKIENLAISTITNANNNLVDELTKFIKEQQRFITTKLENYIEDRKNNLLTAKNETEKIINSFSKDKNQRLDMQNKYVELLENLNILEKII